MTLSSIFPSLLVVLYLFGVPLLVMRLARRWRWIERLSPMTVLYAIGLLVGNSGLLADGSAASTTLTTVGNLTIPLAIPLMLMGCSLRGWSTGLAVRTFFSGLVAVLLTTVGGFFLFRGAAGSSLSCQEFTQVCAVATGIYTGGIANIGAIKQGVGMGQELYLFVTGYDLVATGLYLLFVIFFGKNVFRWLLPPRASSAAPSQQVAAGDDSPAVRPFDAAHRRGTLFMLLLAVAIAAVSYAAVSLLASGSTSLLILLLTTLAIGASFLPAARRNPQSFDVGLYFVYVFCLSVATACNVRQMDFLGSLHILWYILFTIFGSLVLQVLLARLLRIDGDTVLVSSVALINSPPFVPMVAALLGNRSIVVLGITIGLLGYMLGNYLGIGVYHLLLLFCG